MRSKTRKWIVRISVLIGVVVGLIFLWPDPNPYRSIERKDWADKAIRSISFQDSDERRPSSGWVGNRILLMKNGEWMMYRAACAKDELPKIQKDLFIGYSGGQWYYTTYHFCVGMLVAEADPQPQSIDEFVQLYSVRSFDGKVANCLDPTWP